MVARRSVRAHFVNSTAPESRKPSSRALLWFHVVIGVAHGIAPFATRVRENTARMPNSAP
ncbi:hypothetical protein ALI22I_18710 [Saccharothrix sp. ALI-22-I]|nr:hypothetical protein ALI22I_18710 [Saccharothrix sp. ALI-22-I]